MALCLQKALMGQTPHLNGHRHTQGVKQYFTMLCQVAQPSITHPFLNTIIQEGEKSEGEEKEYWLLHASLYCSHIWFLSFIFQFT